MTIVMAASLMAGCGKKDELSIDPNITVEDLLEAEEAEEETVEAAKDYSFEVVIKSYQSSYWEASVEGVEERAKELGVNVDINGPNTESDSDAQINLINAAIEKHPDGIAIAACDREAVIPSLQAAMDAGIPVVCFDSGVPDAPAGSVKSTIATDNYGAGATAAEHLYSEIEKSLGKGGQVRVGEINQDSVSESVTARGLGFIDRFMELAADNDVSVAVTGNDAYVLGISGEAESDLEADVIIEVCVPSDTTVELCAKEADKLLSKEDTIAVFGSNQIATEGIISAQTEIEAEKAKKAEKEAAAKAAAAAAAGTDTTSGTDTSADTSTDSEDPANEVVETADEGVVIVGFDAGSITKKAVREGTILGAVTQSPLAMGQIAVEVLTKIANGETVSDVSTDGYWYDAENMDNDDIAPNLYD